MLDVNLKCYVYKTIVYGLQSYNTYIQWKQDGTKFSDIKTDFIYNYILLLIQLLFYKLKYFIKVTEQYPSQTRVLKTSNENQYWCQFNYLFVLPVYRWFKYIDRIKWYKKIDSKKGISSFILNRIIKI